MGTEIGKLGLFAGALLLSATSAHAAVGDHGRPVARDPSARILIGRNGAPYLPGAFAPSGSAPSSFTSSFTPDTPVANDDAAFGPGGPAEGTAAFGPGGADRNRAADDDGSVLKLTTRVFARLPEPATWAMMILGFGVIGTTVRRRLRKSEVRFNEKIRRIAAGEGE